MLNQFPVSTPLRFLKASRLNFRVVRGTAVFYQEIRFISTVTMGGFLSFTTDPATDSFDDNIYDTLTVRVSVSNFPHSSSMVYTKTIAPGVSPVESFTFVPDEATHLANVSLVAGGGSVTTLKTATSMRVAEPGGAFVQQSDLSNLRVDPDGHGKSIRAWQHRMADDLATLRTAVEAQQATDIANGLYTLEDTWDKFWYIQDGGTPFSDPGAIVRHFSGGLVSANPPTGNLPPIGGSILQIQKSTNAAAQPVFYDLLGVEGANYYPGVNVRNRFFLWAPSSAIDPARASTVIPSYHAPDLVYTTSEILACSETRHRIHRSPVYLQMDHKTLLAAGGFGPDTYDNGVRVLPTGPVDAFGRIQFDTLCPVVVLADFWNAAQPDDYYVQQIYELDPTTNVSPFVIPP